MDQKRKKSKTDCRYQHLSLFFFLLHKRQPQGGRPPITLPGGLHTALSPVLLLPNGKRGMVPTQYVCHMRTDNLSLEVSAEGRVASKPEVDPDGLKH